MKKLILLAGVAYLLPMPPALAVKPPPSNFTATPTDTEMTLRWDGQTGATLYVLQQATASTGPWTGHNVTPPETSYTVSGLQPCTDYFYSLQSRPSPDPWTPTITARTDCQQQGNKPPVIVDQTFTARAGETLNGQVVASDPDGDPLTYTWDVPDSLQPQPNGSFTWVPNRAGTVTVTDPGALSATARVTMQTEYAPFSDVYSRAAEILGVSPAEAQSMGWFGSGDKTGLMSEVKSIPTLLNDRIDVTSQLLGIPKEEVFKLLIQRKIPLAQNEAAGAQTAVG